MALLTILIGLLTWAPAGAEAVDCGAVVVSTRDRLEAVLDHVFERDDEVRADGRFARLDRDIVAWADVELARLPAERRENVLTILEKAIVVDRFRPQGLAKDFWQNVAGTIQYKRNDVVLYVDRSRRASENSRDILVHEMTHLMRGVLDGPIARTGRRAIADRGKRFAVYREEIPAFRAEYRFLHRVYTEADVGRVQRRAFRYFFLKEMLEATDFARFDGWKLSVDFSKVRDDVDQRLIDDFLVSEADAELAARLERAFAGPEHAYVKLGVRSYRAAQARAHARRAWCGPHDIHVAIAGGVAGAGGSWVVPMILRWLF